MPIQETEVQKTENKIDEKSKSIIDRNLRNAALYNPKSASLEKQIRLYLVPLLSLSIFFSILFFATVPAIKKVFEGREAIKNSNVILDQKKVELKELEELRASNELNSDLLDRLEAIIPTAKTAVVDYRIKVKEIAFNNLITQENVTIGEQVIIDRNRTNNPQGISASPELKLVQIPSQFGLKGDLNNFRQMLSDIYNDTDFIIISEMELKNSADGKTSEMDITLAKYQYLPIETEQQERQLLDSVSYKQSPDEEVIDFIRRKTDSLNQTNSDEEI